MTTCVGKRKDGTLCRAAPMTDSRYCFFHNPDAAAQRAVARREGGKARAAAMPQADIMPATLQTGQDVATLLAGCIEHVLTSELDVRRANTVGYLSTVLLKAIEAGAV